MRAIGPGPRHKLDVIGQQQSRAAILRQRREKAADFFARSLVGRREAQQHAGDIARVERGFERRREAFGIGDRRGDQVKARFDEIGHGSFFQNTRVIASEAKQSSAATVEKVDCFAPLAMTEKFRQ